MHSSHKSAADVLRRRETNVETITSSNVSSCVVLCLQTWRK